MKQQSEWFDAILAGDTSTAERLLAAGQDVDKRDRYGQTALMVAAVHGHEPLIDLLLARGPALDVTAKYGLSALMLAVINHRTEHCPEAHSRRRQHHACRHRRPRLRRPDRRRPGRGP